MSNSNRTLFSEVSYFFGSLRIGCQGFTTVAPVLGLAVITGSDSNGLNIDIPATFMNPSDISISAGSMSFDLTYKHSDLGQIRLDTFSVRPGRTTLTMHCYVTAPGGDRKAVADMRDMISQFSMDKPIDVTWTGNRRGNNQIPYLNDAISRLQFTGTAPGVGKTFIRRASIKWGMFGFFKTSVKSKVYVTNRTLSVISLTFSIRGAAGISTLEHDHELSGHKNGMKTS
jgi:hypothetical protein